jgi:hypothetical protein
MLYFYPSNLEQQFRDFEICRHVSTGEKRCLNLAVDLVKGERTTAYTGTHLALHMMGFMICIMPLTY